MIGAAVAIQRAFATEPLVLRIAIHSGAAEQRNGDYLGRVDTVAELGADAFLPAGPNPRR